MSVCVCVRTSLSSFKAKPLWAVNHSFLVAVLFGRYILSSGTGRRATGRGYGRFGLMWAILATGLAAVVVYVARHLSRPWSPDVVYVIIRRTPVLWQSSYERPTAISCLFWQHLVCESCGMQFVLKISFPFDLWRSTGTVLSPFFRSDCVTVNVGNVVVLHTWFYSKVQMSNRL